MTAAAVENSAGQWRFASRLVRAIFLVAIAAAMAVAFLATAAGASNAAIVESGADLTRLLRAMAALKAVMACGLGLAVFWRLGSVVTVTHLCAYIGAVAGAVAGPLLIWDMVHIVSGAALLHGGVLAGVIMLWRDDAVIERLAALVRARRAKQAVLF